jgi:hypothetical protein
MADGATVAKALAGLRPEQLAALGDAINLLQKMRREGDHANEGVISAIIPVPNSGDTAFVLICTCLVLMMTIPGLALFYGGLSQAPNVLATVMHSFSITCLITVLWLIFGYSMAFEPGTEAGQPIIGGAGMIFFGGMPYWNQDVEHPGRHSQKWLYSDLR